MQKADDGYVEPGVNDTIGVRQILPISITTHGNGRERYGVVPHRNIQQEWHKHAAGTQITGHAAGFWWAHQVPAAAAQIFLKARRIDYWSKITVAASKKAPLRKSEAV